MNRLFLITSVMLISLFLGCAKSSDKGKALLEHQLKLVGIPQEIVVNICQDDNDNGTCDVGELQAKVRVNRNDTVAEMWEKVKFDENGKYILHNYDPTKNIIMEIQDRENLKYDNSKLSLKYKPTTEELSVLQSVIDADLLKESDVKKLKESKNRDKIDRVLLNSLIVNQNLLRDENLTKATSLSLNLEKIAKGLKESNLTTLSTRLDECNNDKNCTDRLVSETKENVKLTQQEAEELARSKRLADGYIVKLTTPVQAVCSNDKTYKSSLEVGEKGKINFDKFPVGIKCNITVPSDAVIDANNNAIYDSDDKIIGFEMLAPANGKQITPLTTLLFKKRANGENIDKLEQLVANFDPVTAPYRTTINSGIEKIKIQKLMLLMEILKTTLKQSGDITKLNLSTIVNSRGDEKIEELNIDTIIANLSSDIRDSVKNRALSVQSLIEKLKDFDSSKVDINSFFILFSDGGISIKDALSQSLLTTLPNGTNIFDFIIKPKTEDNQASTNIEEIKSSIKEEIVSINKAPIANAGGDQKVEIGKNVILDGSKSKDSDGDIQSYKWLEGSKTLGDGVSITLNDLSIGTHIITLIVKDDKDAIGSDVVSINIYKNIVDNNTTDENSTTPVDNNTTDENSTTPVDNNTTDENSTTPVDNNTTDENSTTPVDNNATDENSTTPVDNNTTDENSTTPVDNNATDENSTTPVDNNATDENSTTPVDNNATDTNATNTPPVANAGADQTVTEGDTVYFDGSGSSDSDGNITTYEWKNGSTVVSREVSFSSNDLSVGTHTITLTVTDDKGATDSDDVVITVNNASTNNDSSSATPEPTPPPNTEKQVADGYLIKLASPATAYCGDNEYTSSLSVGTKGKITFEHTSIPNNCHIFIPSGATIDSNNNGVLDSNDTVLNFSMKGSSEGSFISPLTTMLIEKEANGEDVTELKAMVQNFDPVECATNIINSSGAEKVQNQKLMLLMETLKTALSESQGNVNISDINISNIIHTQVDESLDDFSVDISSFNYDIQGFISDKNSKIRNLIKIFDDLDPSKIDINSLYINISDQGSYIEDAIRSSLKVTIDASDNLLEIIAKSDANLTALYNQFSSMGAGALTSMGRPTAKVGADITVVEGQDVNLSGLSSYDINGYIVSYEWKEGNSTLATTATFNKNDFTVGTHNLTLIVTDNDNQTDSETIIVTVNSNPNALNHIGTQPAGLISPNGGETWTTDVNETISWNSNLFGDNITLYVLHDDPSDIPAVSSTLNQLLSSKNWYQFENNISNVGNITINPSILNGNGNAYIILIVDGTEDNWDISDNTFTLNSNTGNTLKKTGQTKSYDQDGNEVTDGSIKDDGYYQKGVTPSYTRDDAKEIVTDNITGLIWQDNEEAKTVTKNWEDAKSYCADLSLGGDSDWRLPTIVELQSIVVDGKVNPSIDTTKFVNYTTSYDYWSSTTYASYTNLAWLVSFYYGYTSYSNKSYGNSVRCVRAGQ